MIEEGMKLRRRANRRSWCRVVRIQRPKVVVRFASGREWETTVDHIKRHYIFVGKCE